jgi:hypothetical protein
LSDIIKIWKMGSYGCPKLIPDIEKFLPVAIFKMAATITHKFNIVRFLWNFVEIEQCWICALLWQPFWKWRPVEIFQCRESITNSTLFDFNVLNWFPTLKNFYRSPFSKWPPLYRKNSTLFDFKGKFWFIF